MYDATITTPNPWADVARIVFIGLPASALAGVTAVIIIAYYRVWRADRRLAQTQGRSVAWQGLLPHHVWLISVSYMVFVGMAMVSMIAHLGESIRWEMFAYTVGMVTGLWALWDMIGHERHRLVTLSRMQYPDAVAHPDRDPPPIGGSDPDGKGPPDDHPDR